MTIAEAKLIKIREQVQEHLSLSVRAEMSSQRRAELESDIRERLVRENAVIVAHYYTAPEIQALAEATGGCVSDSLEMVHELLLAPTFHKRWGPG